MKRFAWLSLLLCLPSSSILAGPNSGGVIDVHNPQVSYTADTSDYCGLGVPPDSCAGVNTELDGSSGSDIRVWKVFAVFPTGSSPRLKGISFGIRFDPDSLVISAYGQCVGDLNSGAVEMPGAGWPATDTGTSLVFQATQTDHLVECYWFAGYQYSESPTIFELRDNPDPFLGGTFGDDAVPPELEPIADYGRLGFGTSGYRACPAPAGGGDAPWGGDSPEQDGAEGGPWETDSNPLAFVEMATTTDSAYVATYQALKRDYGLHVLVGIAPDGLICRASDEQRAALSADARVSLVTADSIANVSPDLHPGDPGFAERTWNFLLSPPIPDSIGAGTLGEPPDTSRWGEYGPEKEIATYMMGDVGMSLLFVESQATGPCLQPDGTEDWTIGEIDTVANGVARGLSQLADMAPWPAANLAFHVLDQRRIHTSVEPIQGSSGDQTWGIEVMDSLGVDLEPGQTWADQVYTWDNRRRNETLFDWWYTTFAIRDFCDADGRFANGTTSFHGGPMVVLLGRDGWTYSIHERNVVEGHETSHIFGAADEYSTGTSCDQPFGYLREINGNGYTVDTMTVCVPPKRNCLMRDCHNFVMCPFTAHQIGWRDGLGEDDGDGILDPIKNPAADSSMTLGAEDSIRIGDHVEIYQRFPYDDVWVRTLTASNWNSENGRMLWDGMRYDGTRLDYTSFKWTRDEGQSWYYPSLAGDTAAPVITDLTVIPGPDGSVLYSDTLSFKFTDADTHCGRVRATASPHFMDLPTSIAVLDRFFAERDSSAAPIKVAFTSPHAGAWDLNLCVWDIGNKPYTCEVDSFWAGGPSGVGPRKIYIPQLTLSRGRPNPSRDWVSWDIQTAGSGPVDLRVIGVDGRCLRSWSQRTIPRGATRILWDGRDNRGQRVPSGRYYLVVSDGTGNRRTNPATLVR